MGIEKLGSILASCLMVKRECWERVGDKINPYFSDGKWRKLGSILASCLMVKRECWGEGRR